MSGPPADKPPPSHSGHRERLRARFLKAGETALADYELLELVLFRAIPRRDVKPLAKELLARFGDFAGVAAAPPERLMEVRGVSAAAATEIKIVEAAAQRLAQKRMVSREVLGSWSAMMAYCRTRLARRQREEFHILFLDRKNVLIADEAHQTGTLDHVPVYPREVVKRALELNAAALILVHNHPSGDPMPSRADIEMTKRLIAVGEPLGVRVHDHVVIGADGDASMRQLGLL